MYKKLLLIPGSGGADQPAVRRALELAASGNTEIVVLDIVYEPLLEGYYSNREVYEPLRRRLVEERMGAARTLTDALAAQGRKASAQALWDHPLDLAVARQVVELDIDLVVMQPGVGHRGGLSHAEWRVVARCPAPVLLVKSDGTAPYRRMLAAVDPMHAHAKPEELDGAILSHGRALESVLGAALRVVHCYTPLAELGVGIDAGVRLEEADRALADARRVELEELAAETGLPSSAVEIAAGKPEAVLLGRAEAGETDLIIMGALTRGRLKDFLIGSTAERVLQRSGVDVLAVKPPGMSFARRGQ
jgi:universal stress protein E